MQSKHFFKAIAKCVWTFTIDYQWSSKEPLEKELWPARPAPDYDKCLIFCVFFGTLSLSQLILGIFRK